MVKQSLQLLMVALLAATMLVGTGGIAEAYLTPSNPDVTNPALTAPDGVDLTQHMPASYTEDYRAEPDDTFIIGPGSIPDYLTNPNWAFSPPLTKFVDPLPGACVPTAASGWANCDAGVGTMNKNIPIAIPDIVSYPGSDYYELELVEFLEPMHSELPATRLRGYRQVGAATDTSGVAHATTACVDPAQALQAGERYCTGADNLAFPADAKAHYLGPIIVAGKDRPVRVKFINKLPLTGEGGELFVPVDLTVMGAGDYDHPYAGAEALTELGSGTFSQNRGELHLHGGRTPWISDGTPHQWITPAGEPTTYPKGVSVADVPDMPAAGAGEQTYYWTNQQSSRLMFYHDHAWGITRVNVYVGEAAGYVIRDQAEQMLVDAGILPGTKSNGETSYGGEIPLVIQDKTFVDPDTIKETDPTWAWGSQPWNGTPGAAMTPVKGDLWWPHVYMPAQNPFDITGIAPMGRWAYGPYFWPATQNEFQPVPNPYYHPDCDPEDDTTPGSFGGFCQPWEIPSTPNPSWGAEAFMDTPVVNGTAFPVMEVDPKPYRLRILNAAHDRFFNLSMFIAAKNSSGTWAENSAGAVLCSDTANDPTCTEVKMLPAVVHEGFPATWPIDGRPGGVPDFATRGPDWIMIGTEGGFLPQPVVIPPQPVNWNADPTTFNAGNVNTGSLILGPAERADVVVDFSAFAGQTLILYNDAPAPWPALDPHYDYYTDPNLDNTDMGGAGPTLPGKGPNMRTVMQIRVAAGATESFDMAALQEAFIPTEGPGVYGNGNGVFRQGQDPIIAAQGNMNKLGDPTRYEAFPFDDSYPPLPSSGVSDYTQDFSAYNKVYGATFPAVYPNWGIAQINDTQVRFNGIDGTPYTIPLQPKAIQDEQGETFDMFGRMRAGLGLQITNRLPTQVGFVVQTYSDPSTEILEENGIQVWKITHNGVDTHPVHFHLFDVQVLNRVGWDGFLRLPDPTELGWKDTVRISPLEDTIVALKPVTPRVPFGVPESIRPMNPATAIGSHVELTPTDPATGNARGDDWDWNQIYNFDWEYVWHCHILSHEENDMMRPMSFLFQEDLSTAPVLSATSGPGGVALSWTDPTPVNYVTQTGFGNPNGEIGFRIERCIGDGCSDFTPYANALANQTSYLDTQVLDGTAYSYRVVAYNAAGDSPASNAYSANMQTAVSPSALWVPATSTNGTIFLSWANNAKPIGTGYVVEEATTSDFATTTQVYSGTNLNTTLSGKANGTYYYRIKAVQPGFNDGIWVAGANPCTVSVTVAAPGYMYVPATSTGTIGLGWGVSATTGVTYVVEESTDSGFASAIEVYSGTSRSTTLTGKTNGTYYYRVKAIKAGAADSAWRNGPNGCIIAVTVATPTYMWVPATSNTQMVGIAWGASSTADATYVVEESTDPAFGSVTQVYSGPNRSVTLTGRINQTYYYRVKAIKAGLTDSGWATGPNGCTVTATAVAPAYMWVPATNSNGTIMVGWGTSNTAGATYVVEESTDPAFGTVSQIYSGPNRSATVTGRTSGTYYYRVKTTLTGIIDSSWVNGPNGCVVTIP